MGQIPGYNPQPGQQIGGRYPFTGPNYQKYGEQAGFVYDPYSDQYYRDPKAQKQIYQQQGLIPPDPKKPTLADTLLPIAAVGGTYVLAQEAGKAIPGMLGIGEAAKGGGILSGLGGGGAGSGATAATQATGPFSFGGEAAAADQFVSSAGLGAEPAATGMFDLAGIGAEGNALLPIAGAVGAYDVLSHDYGTGRNALEGAASGAAIGSYFGPQGALIGGGIGLAGGFLKSFFSKPSIKEQVKKRWGNLAENGDPATKTYAQQYLAYLDSDQAKQDAQKDFGEMKANGSLRPEDVWGGHGMFKTFGADWLGKYNEEQRRQISQELINANLLDSRKGDIEITDAAKAKEIANRIVGGQQPAPQNQPPQIPQNIPPIPRPIAQNQPTGMMNQPPPQGTPQQQGPITGMLNLGNQPIVIDPSKQKPMPRGGFR